MMDEKNQILEATIKNLEKTYGISTIMKLYKYINFFLHYIYKAFFLFLIFSFLNGCLMPTSHIAISPYAKLSEIKTIAIWKFGDAGGFKNSGDIATIAIANSLMEQGFKIIPYTKLRDIISIEIGYREGMSLEAGMLTPKVLSRIREETGADAILIGNVITAWCNMMWTPPCWIECSFQLIDIHSGEIVISGNVSDDGYSLQSAAQQVGEELAKKLQKLMKSKK
jgi:hypothetical protein